MKTSVLPEISKNFGDNIDIEMIDAEQPENYARLMQLEDKYKSSGNTFPTIFINGRFITGKNQIKNNLLQAIAESLAGIDNDSAPQDQTASKTANKEWIPRKLSLPAIIAGALLDGVNPCVFTVAIFFISYLFYLKTVQKYILISGLLFIAGCYTAYFLIGVGLYKLINAPFFTGVFHTIIRWAVILSVFLFAVLNLRDYILTRKGKKMKLKLSNGNISKIHSIIRKISAPKLAVPLSFFIGAVVSFIEFPCTGQVYIPIILLIQKQFASGYVYLLIYNFFFIIPLVILLAAMFLGANIAKFYQSNITFIKLIMSIFLFLLLLLFLLIG